MADYYPSIKGSAGDDDDDSGADDNRWTKIPNWIAKILFIKQCCSEKIMVIMMIMIIMIMTIISKRVDNNSE